MSLSRNAMIAALKKKVVPFLHDEGFSGTFPHFRRIAPAGIDLITFQFDQHGGGFVIETGCAPLQGTTLYWGKQVPPEKITAWDLHPDKRKRIQMRAGSSQEDWFRYDNGDFDSAAEAALELLGR